MFFSQETLVDSPVERTVERLSAWLGAPGGQAAAAEALAAGGRVLVRAGFAGLSKTVEVSTMEPQLRGTVTAIPLRWSATGPLGDLFPTLDADLEISAADGGQSRVALNGTYRPPLGPVGELLDRAVLNRAVRVTIRRWLRDAGIAASTAEDRQVAAQPQRRPHAPSRLCVEPQPTSGHDFGGSPAPG